MQCSLTIVYVCMFSCLVPRALDELHTVLLYFMGGRETTRTHAHARAHIRTHTHTHMYVHTYIQWERGRPQSAGSGALGSLGPGR